MPSKFKTFMLWLLPVLLFIVFAWSLNLTLFNWWAGGGPPVQHPEIYRHRGNVFCGISFVLFLTFIVAVWVLARRRKRGSSA
jgi:ABC-type transport system involved in multi-copper enzyme maturation permease subunit